MSGATPREFNQLPHVLEYWIYSTGEDVPGWETITERLARLHSSQEERENTFQTLESLMERKCLTTEYVTKRQVEELFDYPVELIPRNGRGITDADRKTLVEAQLIARDDSERVPLRRRPSGSGSEPRGNSTNQASRVGLRPGRSTGRPAAN